jgi:hypothetical protein
LFEARIQRSLDVGVCQENITNIDLLLDTYDHIIESNLAKMEPRFRLLSPSVFPDDVSAKDIRRWLNDNGNIHQLKSIIELSVVLLSFENLGLTYLPPEICRLGLKLLYLDQNQLSSLPPEIKHLRDLNCLTFDNNQLDFTMMRGTTPYLSSLFQAERERVRIETFQAQQRAEDVRHLRLFKRTAQVLIALMLLVCCVSSFRSSRL